MPIGAIEIPLQFGSISFILRRPWRRNACVARFNLLVSGMQRSKADVALRTCVPRPLACDQDVEGKGFGVRHRFMPGKTKMDEISCCKFRCNPEFGCEFELKMASQTYDKDVDGFLRTSDMHELMIDGTVEKGVIYTPRSQGTNMLKLSK